MKIQIFSSIRKDSLVRTAFLLAMLILGLWMPQAMAQVRVIIDQDMSSDHDDVGDLAVLNALADLGECQIIACIADAKNDGGTAVCMNSINTYFGRSNVPCGRRPDSGGIGGYPGEILTYWPHPLYATLTDPPLAANLYRQVLSTQPDRSVVIVTTGYMNSLQALMQSGPDGNSPLNGMDLIRQKVKLLSCAAGSFPSGDEFNFRVEPAAAEYVVNNWPVAVMYVPFGVGGGIKSAGNLVRTGNGPPHNPIGYAYNGQGAYPTWGQIAAYYAVRTAECQGLFDYVTVGRNNCDATGSNWWTSTPDPTGDQDQAYMVQKDLYKVQQAIDTLVMNSNAPASKGTVAAPNQPSNLRATVVGGTRVDLQWTDNSWNESSFIIERKSTGAFSQIATVGANVTTYSDTGMTGTVTYRVKSRNSIGDSGTSPANNILVNSTLYPVPGYTAGYTNEVSATANGGGGSAPVINSALTATGTVGSAFSYTITATNSPTSRNATGLPAGMSVNTSTGVISGTPTAAGTSNVTISATNASGTGTATLVLTVNPSGGGSAPVINSALTATGTAGSAFSYTITATNSPTSRNATGLPAGLSVNTSTGVISGTPTVAGTSNVTISATNASGTGTATLVLTVNPSGGGGSGTFANASFETPSTGNYIYNPGGSSWTWTNNAGIQHNGSAYQATSAPDGVQTALVQGVGGTLGTMSQSVNFSTAGSYTISFQGARRSGVAQPIRVTVDGNTVGTYTPASDTFANITTAAFSVTSGSHTIMFAATDNSGDKTSFIDLVSIGSGGGGGGAAPSITSSLTATGTVGSAFSYQITASNSPTSYNATGLPVGLSVNTSTGVISGTPSAATTSNITLSATNASGTGTATLVLTVNTSGGGGNGTFANASFETPSTGNYIYNPAGSSWTWTNNAGVQANGSAYGGASAPGGVQTALLQSMNGTLGTMSQSVNFSSAGSYTISFQAARRSGNIQPIRVSVDGTAVGTYTPASNSFALITTAAFNVTAGNHTVMFAATDSVGDKTSFIDLVSINGGGGGGIPAAPTSLTATAGNAQVSLSWAASSGATSYNVYRGTTANGESSTPVATGIAGTAYTNTGLTNGTTYYYKVAAVNSSGTSGYSNEASAMPVSGGGGGTGTFANASFETPSIGGYSYTPAGSSWTFTNNAGIQHNGSAYSGTTTVAPDGTQTALVQGVGGTLGTMSQSVNFTAAGNYTIQFQAARRYNLAQPIRVSVDGTTVGTYTPASDSFALITTAPFTVTTGNHTIQFAATDNSADKTSFIDLVSISTP